MNLLHETLKRKRAGVSFPLTALLSTRSYGCGDFYSLQLLHNWALDTGISIIQILPLNDLGYGRSPYSSISAFAIDPIYISLHLLGIQEYSAEIPSVSLDHKFIKSKKLEILKKYFNKIYDYKLLHSLEEFASKYNWLKPYAAFKILYQKNWGLHWSEWKVGSKYSKELENQILQEHREEAHFEYWLQKIAFEQLSRIKEKMESTGVYLKGDMPILTSDNSADVWSRTELFNRDLTSGAPPDFFNLEGQNWGFPVINWAEMEAQNFSWWKERISYLENFYHLYRIDHVLGMYRIWAIPKSFQSAKYGYFHPQKGTSRKDFNLARLFPEDFVELGLIYEFKPDCYIFFWDFFKYPEYAQLSEEVKAKFFSLSHKYLKEDEAYWRTCGEKILKFLLENTRMLPCAEDLGAVPAFVRESIHELKLIGLDIIRWTRSFEDGSFIPPDKYRKMAVSSLSVHDTSTGLAWWLEEASMDDKVAFSSLLFPDWEVQWKKIEERKKINKDLTDPKIQAISSVVHTKREFFEKKINSLDRKKLALALLKFAFSTNSLFSIHMLQDYIIEGKLTNTHNFRKSPLEEPKLHRINVPGTAEEENWGYTFPFYVEELREDEVLSELIHQLIVESGRT